MKRLGKLAWKKLFLPYSKAVACTSAGVGQNVPCLEQCEGFGASAIVLRFVSPTFPVSGI
jgi:hypothetical protein